MDFQPADYELGPVRLAGWYGEGNLPLLHSKLALCCQAWTGEDDFMVERSGIRGIRAWVGSANWTRNSSRHTELGVWIDDRSFAGAALEFMANLILHSESLGSHELVPTPEMAEADIDTDAIGDYAAQFGYLDDPDGFEDIDEQT